MPNGFHCCWDEADRLAAQVRALEAQLDEARRQLSNSRRRLDEIWTYYSIKGIPPIHGMAMTVSW